MVTTIRGKNSTYRVIRDLKPGGMGEVLLARDENDRRVAIKRPLVSGMADGLARFELEATAAKLDHPNIAKIYEAGVQEDGRPYIAMEYVDGKDLKEIIDSADGIDLLTKLSIIEQVCSGLGYAHQKGFIHRDIKPANIMVQANQVAKIIDFGIAKMIDVDRTRDLTQTSQVIGSLHYIAPERFNNSAIDGRVDIFSAGVLLYLLLTGQLPFAGDEVTAPYRIVHEDPAPLSAHVQDYPVALQGIIDQALAKNPAQRYATAEDFADALHDVIEEVKRSHTTRLFNDAERLAIETRYEPALELLDEAIKIDPSNTQVRKLRKMVREHQDRRKRSERLKEYVARAEGFLAVENYAEALNQFRDALQIDPYSQELKDRIAAVEASKQRYDRSVYALNQAEAAKNRGDVTEALRISEFAVTEDPENTRLLALRAAIAKQLERETHQARLTELFDAARSELAAKNYARVEQLLAEAEAVDRSHPGIEEMRLEMTRLREREEHRTLLEEIHRHVNELLRADNYEQANVLLTRAIDKLPGEALLQRLKLEVDNAAQKFDSIRFVDRALASAQEAFASDPQKSLGILQQAQQHMPGDERLIATERSLRRQADELLQRQQLDQCLRQTRDYVTAEQFDQAIDVLETYRVEHGSQPDIEKFLVYAREQQAAKQRRHAVERVSAQARALVEKENLDEAAKLLEAALQSTAIREYGDAALSNLLEDVQTRRATGERKREAILARAIALRERGDLDAAIRTLNDLLATGVRNTAGDDLLASLQAERTRMQDTRRAIASANEAATQFRYVDALDTLQNITSVYSDTDELTQAVEHVKQARSAHAQQEVSKSIETSRAALLARDIKGALTALGAANPWVEFADPSKQADWRRIGQAAKKASEAPTGTIIVDPLADIPLDQAAGKRVSPVLLGGTAVAAVAIAAVAITFAMKKSAGTAPPPPNIAHIRVAKAAPGSSVSIDGGTAKLTDPSGALTLDVTPGSHLIAVTKDGYEPFNEKFQIDAGGTNQYNITPFKLPPVNNSGTLEMQSNLPAFKVFVDGQSRGEFFKKQGNLTLGAGEHVVQYSNEDGSNTLDKHTVLIAAGKTFTDAPFTLKAAKELPPPLPPKPPGGANPPTPPVKVEAQPPQPPTPLLGSILVHTLPGARVALSNGQTGTADGSGALELSELKPGAYTLDITKDGYLPDRKDGISVAGGSKTPVASTLAPKPAPPVVVAVTPATPAAPVADDHSADYSGIQAAAASFAAAYQSRKLDQLQAVWINAKNQTQRLKETFDIAETVKMSTICPGQATISGDTATQRCNETSQFNKSEPLRTNPFTYTFIKANGKWVLKDRIPAR